MPSFSIEQILSLAQWIIEPFWNGIGIAFAVVVGGAILNQLLKIGR